MEAKKIFLRIISVGAAIIIISGGYIINKAFTGNTKFEEEEVFVYVPTDSKYEDVKKILSPYIENQSKIDWVASKRNYDSNVKPGKFLLKKGMIFFIISFAITTLYTLIYIPGVTSNFRTNPVYFIVPVISFLAVV